MTKAKKRRVNVAGRLNGAVAANVDRSGRVTRTSKTQNVEIIQHKGRTTIVDHDDRG
jgi:hypothetical protein